MAKEKQNDTLKCLLLNEKKVYTKHLINPDSLWLLVLPYFLSVMYFLIKVSLSF